MFIMMRRVGETIMIGDDVTITVVGVNGNHREEIYEGIKRERVLAGSDPDEPLSPRHD